MKPTQPDQDLSRLRSSLGARLRKARASRGLTMRELADAVGITSGSVSQIENGHVMPTIATLISITTALNIRMNDLFDAPASTPGVLRFRERQTYEVSTGVRDQIVTVDPSGKLEVIVSSVDPGCGSGEELYSHGADVEFVLVVRGELRIFVGKSAWLLREGDSITFSGDSPHGYVNPGSDVTDVVWVMTPAAY